MQDKENFNEVNILQSIEKTWESLYRFIYFKVQNRQEAEDITQETYKKALIYLKKHDSHLEKQLSFLKTISLNILRDKWRKKKRDATFLDLKEESLSIESDNFTENVENRIFIENALSTLSHDQREIIEYRILKSFPVSQTAEIMNMKEGTVRVLQYRALKRLAKILNEGGFNNEKK